MNETDWLAFEDEPKPLLAHLGSRASKRKRRLFACACLRRAWHLIADKRSRAAVLLAERFADGLATVGELVAAQPQARAIAEGLSPHLDRPRHAAWGCWCVLDEQAGNAVNAHFNSVQAMQFHELDEALNRGLPDTFDERWAVFDRTAKEEHRMQCNLIREIFGNPFRRLPPARGRRRWEEERATWLSSNGGAVRILAEAIYAHRRFSDLPILADALEDSGCTDVAILGHCRASNEHVRGCWVVDLVLGKS